MNASARLGAVLALPALFILCGPKAGAQTSLYGNTPEEIEATLKHLKNTVPVYKGQIDKVEHHNPYEAMWQQGQSLKDFGLDTLREMDVKKALLDVADAAGKAKFKTPEGNNQYLIRKSVRNWGVEGTKVINDINDYAEKQDKLKAAGQASPENDKEFKGKLDHWIEQAEAAQSGVNGFVGSVKLGTKIISPDAFPEAASRYSEYATSSVLAALYLARAGVSTTGDERLVYAMKGQKEISEVALKYSLVGASRTVGATAALAKVNGELLVRFSVAGIAGYLGSDMQQQAGVLRDNTVSQLEWNLRDAEIKADLAEHALKRAQNLESRRIKEPGGIKFSSESATDLAFKLDITSVEYDPASGKVILAGKKSRQVFDVDVFADLLRLAVEEGEPFFSLDPSKYEDWDGQCNRAHKLIRQRYKDTQVAERVRAICRHPIERGNRTYYYATVDEFDPALATEANKGRDISLKLVFSPEWLRGSEVGWMLYEADLAIKGVAGGFVQRGPDLVPSAAWDMPGFDPAWLHIDRFEHGNAGRANFELDEQSRAESDGGRLDLSEIRPKLVIVARKSGTDEDLPPSPRCLAISQHFSEHWKDYVEGVPEIARLEMIYRAYVGARFLANHNPGLAARIRQLPRSAPIQAKTLRYISPDWIFVSYENGLPVPLEPGYNSCYTIDGIGTGGAAFKTDHVKIQESQTRTVSWAHDALGSSKSGTAFVEHGNDEAAFALEVAVDPVPSSAFRLLKIVLGSLVGLGALGGLLARRFDWQQIAIARTCAHCGRIHGWLGRASLLGDVVAAALLFYLPAIPFVAAAYEKELEWRQYLLLLVLFIGGACALMVMGAALLALVILASRRRFGKISVPGAFFCGSRLVATVLSCVLLHGGISNDAMAGSIFKLLGQEPGQRLLVLLGDARLVTYAAIAMLAAALAAFLLRWLGPLLCGSRPLYFMKNTPHTHSATAASS